MPTLLSKEKKPLNITAPRMVLLPQERAISIPYNFNVVEILEYINGESAGSATVFFLYIH